jgi:uncharacterized protein YkwD
MASLPRSLSLLVSTAVFAALPATLLLVDSTRPNPAGHRSPDRMVALRGDQPAHDWYTIPPHAVRSAPTAQPSPWPVAATARPATIAAPAPAATRPAPPPPPPPRPAIWVNSRQQVLINIDRAAAGLAPLSWSPCLYAVALQNARRMAAQGYISHANGVYQDLACGLGNRSGENVGYTSAGINDGLLNTMFMNSPEHRANILGPFRYVGTAWAVASNGYAYIAVEFD